MQFIFMSKNFYFILVLIAIGFTSCVNNAYTPPPPSTETSYLPQTLGSTWRYRDSIYGEQTDTVPIIGVKVDTVTYTINGNTTDFNSKICYNAAEFSRVYGTTTAYTYVNKHHFGFSETIPPFGFTNFEYLVDTAAAGYIWDTGPTNNGLLHGNPIKSVNKILETNITKVVGKRTFTNVVHSSSDFMINTNGFNFQNIAHYEFYVAKGVGLIEKDTYVYGSLNGVETILDYSIK